LHFAGSLQVSDGLRPGDPLGEPGSSLLYVSLVHVRLAELLVCGHLVARVVLDQRFQHFPAIFNVTLTEALHRQAVAKE
jgi:hypothetical protein